MHVHLSLLVALASVSASAFEIPHSNKTASSLSLTNAPAQAAISTLGYLKCTETTTTKVIGYVSRTLTDFGDYTGVSASSQANDIAHRMLVSVDLSVAGAGAQDLLVKNAPDNDFPFLGGVGGELGSTIGSDGAYLHLSGTRQTTAGAKPSFAGNTYTDATNRLRKCASAMWLVNTTTSAVTPQWVNDDGSTVLANVGWLVDSESFILTADTETFEKTWDEEVEWITLSLET